MLKVSPVLADADAYFHWLAASHAYGDGGLPDNVPKPPHGFPCVAVASRCLSAVQQRTVTELAFVSASQFPEQHAAAEPRAPRATTLTEWHRG